jgi:hypothetical protein
MFRQRVMCFLFTLTAIGLAATSASAQPSLDGRWLVGEIGDEFEAQLEITGDQAVLTRFGEPDDPDSLTLDSTHAPLYQLSFAEEPIRMLLLLETPNEARLWIDGDPGMARRVGEVPAALLGTWHFMESPDDQYQVTFTATEATFTMEDETERSPVYGLASDGPLVELAIAEPGDVEPIMMHLVAMPENSYILVLDYEEDAFVLYQGDAAPSWTAVMSEPAESDVCMAAYEHIRGCLEALCTDNPDYPACGILDQPPPVNEPCPPEMEAMSTEILSKACDEIFPVVP